ncbi:hypothetical protein [Sporosalibacterium faouarense]|uniref:hypothetical protein n=1 Tax=Sporosalibacterium faouarense TaxID=516123 RepID=UPI00141C6F99|nr:hypothetical protein [Sporosalibacterium faouarense]MTI49643.1 hypothetical protein [Bacillota bacterium]
MKYAIANVFNGSKEILSQGLINIYAKTIDQFEIQLEESIYRLSEDTEKLYFTTTATLLYESLSEGADRIASIVIEATTLNEDNIYYYSKEGNFKPIKEFRTVDIQGCYNWCITRDFIKRKVKEDSLIIDCGSSSTDIVPININIKNNNYSIHERMIKEELLYIGMRRTLVQTISNSILMNGHQVNLVGETTTRIGDINYILGHINKEEYALDNDLLTERMLIKRAYFNVARLVCGDLNIISRETLDSICQYISEEMKSKVLKGITRVIKENFYGEPQIILCGIGSNFLKEHVLKDTRYKKLIPMKSICNLKDIKYTPALGIIELL